jgi:hypothetical protein
MKRVKRLMPGLVYVYIGDRRVWVAKDGSNTNGLIKSIERVDPEPMTDDDLIAHAERVLAEADLVAGVAR